MSVRGCRAATKSAISIPVNQAMKKFGRILSVGDSATFVTNPFTFSVTHCVMVTSSYSLCDCLKLGHAFELVCYALATCCCILALLLCLL
jgi:hypothetical protein